SYLKLEKYGENLSPYLQSELARLQIEKAENDLKNLIENIQPLLQAEKQKTRDYLEKKVHDFFYTKLINKLYNKIDPHPDFKSVQVRPDFDLDLPRLDIYVVSTSGE